jgi:hypothetical protein
MQAAGSMQGRTILTCATVGIPASIGFHARGRIAAIVSWVCGGVWRRTDAGEAQHALVHPSRECVTGGLLRLRSSGPVVAAWCLWFVSGVVLGRNETSGVEFEAEGSSTYKVLSGGAVYVQQEDHITVSVRGCEWLVKKVPIRFLKGGKEQPLAHYGVASSDSTNFYQVSSFPRAGEGSSMDARIGPGGVPFGLSDPKYIVLWYMFGSSCYFQHLQGRYVNPPTVLLGEAHYAKDFRVLASWELENAAPNLPKMIAFDSVPRWSLEVRRDEAPIWHSTSCRLVVQEFTNRGGLLLPKRVLAEYFGSSPTNQPLPFLTGSFEVRMTNFHAQVSVTTFRPDISRGAFVSDMRTICSNTPFGVVNRAASDWPRLESSRAKAQSVALAKRGSRASTRRVSLVRIGLVALILAPGMFWFVLRRLETTKERNKIA